METFRLPSRPEGTMGSLLRFANHLMMSWVTSPAKVKTRTRMVFYKWRIMPYLALRIFWTLAEALFKFESGSMTKLTVSCLQIIKRAADKSESFYSAGQSPHSAIRRIHFTCATRVSAHRDSVQKLKKGIYSRQTVIGKFLEMTQK